MKDDKGGLVRDSEKERNLERQKDPGLHGKEVTRQPRPLNGGTAKMGTCGAQQEKDKGYGEWV